jgi:hypothetical protein
MVQTAPFENDDAETIQIHDDSAASYQLHQINCNSMNERKATHLKKVLAEKAMISSEEEKRTNEAVDETSETVQIQDASATSYKTHESHNFPMNERKAMHLKKMLTEKQLILSTEENSTKEAVDGVLILANTENADASHVMDDMVSRDIVEVHDSLGESETSLSPKMSSQKAKLLMQYLQSRTPSMETE